MDYLKLIPGTVLNLILSKLRINDLRRIEDYWAYQYGEPLGIFGENVARIIINYRYPQFWKLFNQSFSKKYSPSELTLFVDLLERDPFLRCQGTPEKDLPINSLLILNIKSKNNHGVSNIVPIISRDYLTDILSELFLMNNVPILYSKIVKYGMGDLFSKRKLYAELINLCKKCLSQGAGFSSLFERYIIEELAVKPSYSFYANISTFGKQSLLVFLFFIDLYMESGASGDLFIEDVITYVSLFRSTYGPDITEILKLNPQYDRYINNDKYIFMEKLSMSAVL
jgi:hypothetical protein